MKELEFLPIVWKLENVDCTNHSYWNATVRDVTFLCLVDNVLDTGTKYYIHPSFQTFKTYGNRGIYEWGWFTDIDVAKAKAEELIREELYSFFKTESIKEDEITHDKLIDNDWEYIAKDPYTGKAIYTRSYFTYSLETNILQYNGGEFSIIRRKTTSMKKINQIHDALQC